VNMTKSICHLCDQEKPDAQVWGNGETGGVCIECMVDYIITLKLRVEVLENLVKEMDKSVHRLQNPIIRK